MGQNELQPAQRRILILAGPNGAGKTTFAREFLPGEAQCPTFVNADLIAAGLSPFRPEAAAMRAGRLMLELMDGLVARGESFAFETTLADRGYARRISSWQGTGYHVTILFLALPSPDAAILRYTIWHVGRIRMNPDRAGLLLDRVRRLSLGGFDSTPSKSPTISRVTFGLRCA